MGYKVTISIVSYCQRYLLDRCLAHIQNLPLPSDWQTIVVDNNSSDGSADMVTKKYHWVELIKMKQNIGFAGGHNTAYARTNSFIFIVLNPDVIVLPGSLDALVQAFDQFPMAAIIGPRLLNPDGSPQFSARRFYTWWAVACRRLPMPGKEKTNDHHLMKDLDLNQTLSVDWILGAVMAIRRSAFAQDKLFDTRYKLYFEDVDLCYFAKQDGWQVLYYPVAKMIHDHQRISAKKLFSSAIINHLLSWIKFCLKKRAFSNRCIRRQNSLNSG